MAAVDAQAGHRAVNGVAAGGGFVLTVMSDLRIASTNGSFISIFSKRGLIAEHGTTWIVPRLIGAGAALDLLWSSRKIDAAEAHRIGLVQQVVEPDDLLAAARRYVVDLAENVSPASWPTPSGSVYEGFGVRIPRRSRRSTTCSTPRSIGSTPRKAPPR